MNILTIFLSGIFIFLVVYVLLVIFTGRFLHLIAHFATKTPDNKLLEGFSFENIVFLGGTGKNNLRGWFIHPQSEVNGYTIILIPGWWHTRTTLLPHIKFFSESGYNVFVYDQRSHGASDIARLTFGREEGEDFIAAVDYILAHKDVNQDKMIAVGESLGSSALIFGIPKRKIFKSIIIEGPYAGSKCMGYHMFTNRVGSFWAKIFVPGWWVGGRLWCDGNPKNGYPSDYVHLLSPTPILFIRGDDDYMVPEKCAFELINNAGEPKELWLTPASGHRKALQTYPDEYKRRILEFLQKNS